MLTLENLSCRRGSEILFKGVGITIGDSAIVLVRGDNGCGKTTLLESIACLRPVEEGRILYAGKEVKGEHYKEYCDIIQYVGHKPAIKLQMTVEENISFWAKLRNNERAVAAAITFFDLDEYANNMCCELSAGYKKRVSLACLMVSNADIWLLDEPFTNLDETGKNTLSSLIAAKCERGGSVIVTSHNELPFKNYLEINLMEYKWVL